MTEREWQTIDSADKRANRIELRTAGGHILVGFWHDQLVDSDNLDCGGWAAAEGEEYPPCWTDGVCWLANGDGKPSDPPTHWRTPKDEAP